MFKVLSHVSIPVRDYDEAKQWYTEMIGLEVRSDQQFGPGYRWLTVGVPGQTVEIVLHRTDDSSEISQAQPGQAFGFVFETDDCRADVERLRSRGVKIVLEPEQQMWGTQAVIADLYGNTHVLVQRPTGS
jgi:catechol 2,3-dioxygenase-like lactoylglutathione lyase family enzyme